MCEFCRWYVKEHGPFSDDEPELDATPVETDDDGDVIYDREADYWSHSGNGE